VPELGYELGVVDDLLESGAVDSAESIPDDGAVDIGDRELEIVASVTECPDWEVADLPRSWAKRRSDLSRSLSYADKAL